MNCSDNTRPNVGVAKDRQAAVLVAEAGVAFHPPLGKDSGVDPVVEWLSLMEVVQMLCPVWPVREKPMQGMHWRL